MKVLDLGLLLIFRCVHMQAAATEAGPASVRSVITTQLSGYDS